MEVITLSTLTARKSFPILSKFNLKMNLTMLKRATGSTYAKFKAVESPSRCSTTTKNKISS